MQGLGVRLVVSKWYVPDLRVSPSPQLLPKSYTDPELILLHFVCRLLLQHIKLSSRCIAIIGLAMSIAGCALIADWQAVSFDKCTYFSPYHNPTLHMNRTVGSLIRHTNKMQKRSGTLIDEKISCYTVERENCFDNCHLIQYSPGVEFSVLDYPCDISVKDQHVLTYMCQVLDQDQSFCLHIETSQNEQVSIASAQNNFLIQQKSYKYEMKQCTQANVGNDRCYWIPDSFITKHYCRDCPPICRGISKSLDFAQFCIGAALLMLSIPVAWVPVASMASERTTKETQVCRSSDGGTMTGLIIWASPNKSWFSTKYNMIAWTSNDVCPAVWIYLHYYPCIAGIKLWHLLWISGWL